MMWKCVREKVVVSSQGNSLISLFVSLKYSNKIFIPLFLVSTLLNFKSRLYPTIFAYENISNKGKIVLSNGYVGPWSFTYVELEKIIDDCKEELGRASFGIFYKGTIGNDQKIVAAKRLEKLLVDWEREFQLKMKVIGKTHHKNLICLLGYCHDGLNRLLVYEYMCNGSLTNILFTSEKNTFLEWKNENCLQHCKRNSLSPWRVYVTNHS